VVGGATSSIAASMGASQSTKCEPVEVDAFKSIFRVMAATIDGAVEDGSAITVVDFVTSIKANPEALALITTLGNDGGGWFGNSSNLSAGDETALQALFKAMDTDSDGELTWAEWNAYVSKKRTSIVATLFAKLDPQKTGAVDAPAFVEALKSDSKTLALYNLCDCTSEALIAKHATAIELRALPRQSCRC
jgi:hypothetical protein